MADEHKDRLPADVTECQRASLAAWSALTHPAYGVADGSADYRKLLQADAEARVKYSALIIGKPWIAVALACIALAGCGNTAQPAPNQTAPVTQSKESPKTPVAVTPDASAANTGNVVNGPQPSTKTGK
jgi:predicted small secreted protein